MSFNSWLQNLRSALTPGRGQRHHGRRGSLRAAAHRPNLEILEDRCLLSFSPITSYPVGTNLQAVVTADFNNDGNLDLAAVNGGGSYVTGPGNTITVRLGNGLGGFGAANNFPTDNSPRSMAVGDFDNDGNIDVATVNGDPNPNNTLSVLMGEGDGTFRPPVDTDISAVNVAAGDFNADGNTDLVYTFKDFFGDYSAVVVLLADGLGGFAEAAVVELDDLYKPVGLAVADLNGDGRPDVVTANYYEGTVSVLLGNGYGLNFTTGQAPQAVAVGDFTGDGIPDLVTAGQMVNVLPGLGDGTFAPPIYNSANSSGMTTVAAADFNGDGKLDVVTSDPGAGTVSVLLGLGDGTLTPPIDHAAGSSLVAVAVGDFNGDGRPDVAAATAGSNTVSVLLNDGAWPDVNTPTPWLQIRDVTVTEGNTGIVAAVFIVTLSPGSDQPVTVAYATGNGTATAGSDYQAASGTLIIPAGQTTGTITVLVNGDRLGEPNETFSVNLSSPTNATIGDGYGMGTIVDNEPRISISDVTKAEGKKGQKTLFTFTVTLSAAYDQAVTMSFRTVDGSATTSDGDYVAKTGTLTFAPGEKMKTITIEVKGDSKKEANETFYLELFGNSNSLFTKSRGIGTILNDD